MATGGKESSSPSKRLPANKLAGGAAQEQRRVTFALSEALQLVDFSHEEVLSIEKSIKKLQDAIHRFSLVTGYAGADDETSALDADLAELYENLKASSSVLDTTCSHVKKSLQGGKKTIISHKRVLSPSSPSSFIEPQTWSPTKQTIPNLPAAVLPYSSGTTTTTSSSPTKAPSSSTSTRSKSAGATSKVVNKLSPVMGPVKSKTAPRVPLGTLLDMESSCGHHYITQDFFNSILHKIQLEEKEFLGVKDLHAFMQEVLFFSISKSHAMSFLSKSYHRRLIGQYANDLVFALLDKLQLTPPPSGNSSSDVLGDMSVAVPHHTFRQFMSEEPFRFDALLQEIHVDNVVSGSSSTNELPSTGANSSSNTNPFAEHFSRNGGLLHGSKVITAIMHQPETERFETAEQTLAMAKLLHDLATAESEAKHGSKISIRPVDTRSKEFSKAYLNTSKELLLKETTGYFAS